MASDDVRNSPVINNAKEIAIERYKKEHLCENPPEIFFKTIDEYNSIEHYDHIIHFPAGGKVGDREWTIQYMHNASVILKNKRDKNPTCAPTTYVYLEKYQPLYNVKNISVHVNDILFSKISFIDLEISNSFMDIKPNILHNPFIDKKFVFYVSLLVPSRELACMSDLKIRTEIEYLKNGVDVVEPIEIYEASY
jgi:hypothetical protein